MVAVGRVLGKVGAVVQGEGGVVGDERGGGDGVVEAQPAVEQLVAAARRPWLGVGVGVGVGLRLGLGLGVGVGLGLGIEGQESDQHEWHSAQPRPQQLGGNL